MKTLVAVAALALASLCAHAQSPRAPTAQELEEEQRLQPERFRLISEFNRLTGLGKFDEAEAVGRQLDELMSRGYLGEVMRQSGRPAASYEAMAKGMRESMKSDQVDARIPDPLFVQPAPLYTDDKLVEMGVPAEPAVLNNRGIELHQAGDVGGAARAYEAALAEAEKTLAHAGHMAPAIQLNIPPIAANIGLARWQLGNHDGAEGAFAAALAARARDEGSTYDPFQGESESLAMARVMAVELEALVTLSRATGRPELALVALLERKGRVLERQARALAAMRQGGHASGRRMAQELIADYESVTAERAAIAGRPRGTPSEEAQIAQRMDALELRLQAMLREMAVQKAVEDGQPGFLATLQLVFERDGKAAVERDIRKRPARADTERKALLGNVQAALPRGAALVEMVKYREFRPAFALEASRRFGAGRYGAFLLTRDAAPVYVDLGEAEPIEKLVQDFRKALADPARPVRELARRLDEALMRPLRAQIGKAQRLYVAPEAALNLVPLAALVDEEGRFLVERYTFTYLASGRDLVDRGDRQAPRSGAVVIADPAFTLAGADADVPVRGTRSLDFGSMRFDPLPGTAAEAVALRTMLPDATVATGAHATESLVKSIRGPRILHVATHGFFLDEAAAAGGDTRALQVVKAQPRAENPMLRSGIVFAGVNELRSGRDDGVLTALEAAALDLRGTKLVVLSACETGLGEVRTGEGVFGLRRAFSVAGAESLVMSLWQVSDEATMRLMKAYYARLGRGEGRSEALRLAQLELLKEPNTAAPFFWAAFIPSGEPGPL